MRRARGFSLLEVLLAIALLGSGIMSLLVVRANCIDNAADTIRLRSVRLLVGQHAGHHLAYHCDPGRTPSLDDWQEEFPEYSVQPQIDEVSFDELLPDEIKLLARSKEEAEGNAPPPPTEATKPQPLLLRRLTLLVAPPGVEDVPALTVKIVTYKLAPPTKDGAGPPAAGGPGAAGSNFPTYPAPLVGPGSEPQAPPAGETPPGETPPGQQGPGGPPPEGT